MSFLAGTGAILLTFLAGAELDPDVFRVKWKESLVVGLASFGAPFLGAAAAARWLLGWEVGASWLAGVALSTTSVAVVYAVMLELGFNTTEYGKAMLAACFVTDLGTVLALGLIFSPFTFRTLVFAVTCGVLFAILPIVTPRVFRRYGGRVSELETKFILLALFALGGLAIWAGSEAVLPAYVIGMLLAGSVGREEHLPHYAASISEVKAAKEQIDEYYHALTKQARDQAALSGVELETVIRQGHEVETIVTMAKEGKFDLLVIGCHGHSGIFGRTLGSAAQSIVRLAPCPVLLAK